MAELLKVEQLTKRFGGLLANHRIDFHVDQGEMVGLIGPNGAGKTTFFNVLTGFYKPDGGRVLFTGLDVTGKTPEWLCIHGLTRTFQVVKTLKGMTVLENVMVGAFVHARGTGEARRQAEEILRFGGLYKKKDMLAGGLTIADKKRLEMLRALATQPKLLLLDEAMAGLNPAEVQDAVALVRRINQEGVTIILVEHVMEVVMPLSHRVVVLAGGEKIAEGPPEAIAHDPVVIEAYLGEKYARRQQALGEL
ncbi:MAG TPA: ABC transporter ATP-binding protein [Anaerolineae bacterium]|nr:ABC transporter ATP-binding protein [Caldilineae bacterium]HID34054.1 ABC transporter ATP-binding protein [Anaerolineae bacterium]